MTCETHRDMHIPPDWQVAKAIELGTGWFRASDGCEWPAPDDTAWHNDVRQAASDMDSYFGDQAITTTDVDSILQEWASQGDCCLCDAKPADLLAEHEIEVNGDYGPAEPTHWELHTKAAVLRPVLEDRAVAI
jgi:hypothetical protein